MGKRKRQKPEKVFLPGQWWDGPEKPPLPPELHNWFLKLWTSPSICPMQTVAIQLRPTNPLQAKAQRYRGYSRGIQEKGKSWRWFFHPKSKIPPENETQKIRLSMRNKILVVTGQAVVRFSIWLKARGRQIEQMGCKQQSLWAQALDETEGEILARFQNQVASLKIGLPPPWFERETESSWK